MNKKHLTALLTAGAMFSAACVPVRYAAVSPLHSVIQPCAASETGALSDFAYAVNPDGKSVTVTAYKGHAAKLIVPQEIAELPVTAIGQSAFRERNDLTDITIPEGVTRIADEAFAWCGNLKSVSLPDTLTEIGESAFAVCSSLTAFTVPEGVRRIGGSAFWRCENLLSVGIPRSLKQIGAYAFEVTAWLDAKREQTALVIVNDILIDGGRCEGKVVIPEGVKAVNACAFYDCGDITQITLPESVTAIGSEAFEECVRLTAVNIPDGVMKIGSDAFNHCIGLNTLTVPAGVQMIGDNAFDNCPALSVSGYSASYAEEYMLANDIPFESLGDAVVTAVEIEAPDLNGDGRVNIADVVLLSRFTGEDETLSAEQAEKIADSTADFDGDGKLTVLDVCQFLKKIADDLV